MEGTRPLRGQPYPVFKCGLYVKVKVNFNTNTVFDFDFKHTDCIYKVG